MNEIFDYKEMITEWREQLWQRMAAYVLAHPQERARDIARKFNVNKTLLQLACEQNGLKRKQGRKSFHFPPKA